MSSLLSDSQIYSKTGIFARHFDTFSNGRNLIVHKEPKRVIVNSSENIYAGYQFSSNEDNFIMVPVSGIFPVIKVDNKNQNSANQPDVQSLSSVNMSRIKVQKDAREFIKNGRNELFEMDGISYNNIGGESVQNFQGLIYYYFTLYSTT